MQVQHNSEACYASFLVCSDHHHNADLGPVTCTSDFTLLVQNSFFFIQEIQKPCTHFQLNAKLLFKSPPMVFHCLQPPKARPVALCSVQRSFITSPFGALTGTLHCISDCNNTVLFYSLFSWNNLFSHLKFKSLILKDRDNISVPHLPILQWDTVPWLCLWGIINISKQQTHTITQLHWFCLQLCNFSWALGKRKIRPSKCFCETPSN